MNMFLKGSFTTIDQAVYTSGFFSIVLGGAVAQWLNVYLCAGSLRSIPISEYLEFF